MAMNTQSIALTMPVTGSLHSGLRSISASMVGGVGGLAVALTAGLNPAIPVLTGLVLGLALGSPARPQGLENVVSTAVLATGGAFWAGTLLIKGAVGLGIPLAAVSLGLVAGTRGASKAKTLTRYALTTFAFAFVMAAFQAFTDVRLPTAGSGQLLDLLMFSGALGGAAFVGSGLDLKLLPGEPLDGPKMLQAIAPVEAEIEEVVGVDSGLFQEEERRLTKASIRIEDLAAKLTALAPEETGFVEQLRNTLETTLEQTKAAINRWRMVKVSTNELHAEVLRERLQASTERLEKLANNEPLKRMLEDTVRRQTDTLAELERLDSDRRAFEMRLEQVQSGLELLELTVERVLTAGGSIDSTEVDAIVEAMADVHAVLEYDV